ncbi:MAG: DUF2878 domain-containing protein [Gammaproteobacteria bacterium]|jgi:hypothetical protein
MKHKLINFLLFQAGWLAVVLLGSGQYHWLGPAVVAAVVAWHLVTSPAPQAEARLILVALGIGLVWENLLTLAGVVVYPNGQLLGDLAPVWIVAMWAMLATTLNLSLRWLHGRFVQAFAFGAIGGPLAFLAGERLGAAVFPDTTQAMLVLAAGWGVLFTLLVLLAMRNDGFLQMFPRARRAES